MSANADNPRRLAVEAQAAKLRRTIGRDCVETLLALQARRQKAVDYGTYVQACEADGALERFLDDLDIPAERR